MTSSNCCAIYARVSTDKQSPLSPLDQIQKCKDFALELGMESREEFVFIDDAMSGFWCRSAVLPKASFHCARTKMPIPSHFGRRYKSIVSQLIRCNRNY